MLNREIVAYYRVSTKMQGFDGLGMAAQRAAVERFADGVGAAIVATYEEVESSSRSDLRNRPQLAAAVAHVRRSKAILVIARLDRLARNVFVTSQLLESGIEFVACDNPHASRLTIQILAVMAEHESRLISARVKAAMAASRARGVEPYRGGRLTPEAIRLGVEASRSAKMRRTREAYADLAPLLRSLRVEGRTHGAIAEQFNALGQRNQYGGLWSCHSVRSFLRREGLSEMKAVRKYENHLTGSIQQAGVAAHRAATRRRTEAYYEPYLPLIRGLFDAGRSSKEIARELDSRGIRTQGGSTWYPSIVFNTLRRAGIAPPPRQGEQGLTNPKTRKLGQAAAAARISAMARSHRGRVMPIIRWLLDLKLSYSDVSTYLNNHGYTPARVARWNSGLLATFIRRDPPLGHREWLFDDEWQK